MSSKKCLEELIRGQKPIMNNYVTEAINLKSYNLNDADKIIVMYSKDNGLIKGVAKGIKKPKSKLGARMDLLVANSLQLLKGRSMDTILQAQTVNNFNTIHVWNPSISVCTNINDRVFSKRNLHLLHQK